MDKKAKEEKQYKQAFKNDPYLSFGFSRKKRRHVCNLIFYSLLDRSRDFSSVNGHVSVVGLLLTAGNQLPQ